MNKPVQRRTQPETCIGCPAALVCITRSVVLKRCGMCRQVFLGILHPKDGFAKHYVLLPKKQADKCPQKLSDKWSWVCERCVAIPYRRR
jgi:hypothetical protein